MIDFSDPDTPTSLRELVRVATSGRPIVFWIGAGASRWAGYPSWDEVAKRVHRDFVRRVPGYDHDHGLTLLATPKFPELFDLCSRANRQRYLESLLESLRPTAPVRTYLRFLAAIQRTSPVRIVTTNVDEELEHRLGPIPHVLQNTDLERLARILPSTDGFIAKLHGTLSQANSLIFAATEHRDLVSTQSYRSALRNVFYNSHVVFVGYGLADDYVVALLREVSDDKSLFGDGPHFLISGDVRPLPGGVLRIRYRTDGAPDHRSAIQALEEIWLAQPTIEAAPDIDSAAAEPVRVSAHLLADVFPPGNWTTSSTLLIARKGEELTTRREAIIGEGWSAEELPYAAAIALHDLLVGLICFDTVFAPLFALSRLHSLVSGQYLSELAGTGALRLIQWQSSPAVIFPSGGLAGDLAFQQVRTPDGRERSIIELIRQHLRPVHGKEAQAEALFEQLSGRTLFVPDEGPIPLATVVRGLLVRPSMKAMLGLSDAVPVSVVPRWSTFPVLRLARLVQLAQTCQRSGIASLRIQYGMPELVGAAFQGAVGAYQAEEAASFVLSGRFDSDLGSFVASNSDVFAAILKFRDTEEGLRLRREVLSRIDSSAGADIAVAINGGLKSVIPFDVLQRAKDQLAGLLTQIPTSGTAIKAAVWNEVRYDKNRLALWRLRSRAMLDTMVSNRGLPRDAPCPCGSGEMIKDCCRATLRRD